MRHRMTRDDRRTVLQLGPPKRLGDPEITVEMVADVRRRILTAGGVLTVWAVLHEDLYETWYGDGRYFHVCAIALNGDNAESLSRLPDRTKHDGWSVEVYRVVVESELPTFMDELRPDDEFTINDFVAILCEIPPGWSASKLMTGPGTCGRSPGPHMLELPSKRP